MISKMRSYEKNKNTQGEFIFVKSQYVDKSITDHLSKIATHQIQLFSLLNLEDNLVFHHRNTIYLSSFLSEMRARISVFIIQLDEIASQIPTVKIILEEPSNCSIRNFYHTENVAISTLKNLTEKILNLLSVADTKLINFESLSLIRQMLKKLCIFYKQSAIVLNSYLRGYC